MHGLLDMAGEAYLVVDAAGRVAYANRAAGLLFRRAPEDLVGAPAEPLLAERDRAAFARARADCVAAMEARPAAGRAEGAILRAEGAESPIEWRMTPLRASGGPLVAVALHDVSLRREAEEARTGSIARPLARRIIHDLVETGGVAHQILQQVGRRLAAETPARGLADYARAFAEMGLGRVEVDKDEGARCSFVGADLLEKRPGSRLATCAFTLGYLSEAVSRTHGGETTLGTEIECQSRGAHRCRFIVQVKKPEEGLARRVKELI